MSCENRYGTPCNESICGLSVEGICTSMNGGYKDYIKKHRKGVVNTWDKILKPVLQSEGVDSKMIHRITSLVHQHDYTKLTMKEYGPYSTHYNDPEKYPKSTSEYRKAWNNHQKNNPHHWQYWVLLEDIENPKMIALEMDFEYVIEMLCDWQSASDHYGNTAHWWYETQKDNMILHDNTRKLIEKYLEYLN